MFPRKRYNNENTVDVTLCIYIGEYKNKDMRTNIGPCLRA